MVSAIDAEKENVIMGHTREAYAEWSFKTYGPTNDPRQPGYRFWVHSFITRQLVKNNGKGVYNVA